MAETDWVRVGRHVTPDRNSRIRPSQEHQRTSVGAPEHGTILAKSPPFERCYNWTSDSVCAGGQALILDEVVADVSSQLDEQFRLGVHITPMNEVPDTGPSNRGVWYQIPQVTAVFADLKRSTALSAEGGAVVAALAYTHFIRAMAVILDRFEAKYVDIQGDGIFGLFSGKGSRFLAVACAITMRTEVEREVAVRFDKHSSTDWELTAGVGIDHGTLLVRRLGLRRAKQNEVWA